MPHAASRSSGATALAVTTWTAGSFPMTSSARGPHDGDMVETEELDGTW